MLCSFINCKKKGVSIMGMVPDYMLARESAWHGLGEIIGRYFTVEELLAAGGGKFTFPVEKHRLVAPTLINPYTNEPFQNETAIEAYATFRMDTGAFLASVGADYTVVPHLDGLPLVQQLFPLAERGKAYFETAFTLQNGGIFCCSAKLPFDISVGDDKTEMFLSYVTSHTGRYNLLFYLSGERPVCENTIEIGLSAARGVFRVHHTKNANLKLKDAAKALSALEVDVKSAEEKMNFLNTRKVTAETAETIFNRLFPQTKREDGREDSSTRRNNILADIYKRFELNEMDTFKEQRGTAYSLLQSVTDYVDHGRSSHNGDKGRYESAILGSGNKLKSQAFEVILETAKKMPVKVAEVGKTYVEVPTSEEISWSADLDAILEQPIRQ
jgi:phage/plasmid-like protein (TIGR03299 family)